MRVLVIEDEVRLAENIASALREGTQDCVDCAEDGEKGLSLVQQQLYDVVVLDLMLPRMCGVQVLTKQPRLPRQRGAYLRCGQLRSFQSTQIMDANQGHALGRVTRCPHSLIAVS